jgi:hypothetical protein
MQNTIKNVHTMATTAMEALKLAFEENTDRHSSGLILIALAKVSELREEVAEITNECVPNDAEDYCYPV